MTEKLLFWGILVFLFATLAIGMWAAKQVKFPSHSNWDYVV